MTKPDLMALAEEERADLLALVPAQRPDRRTGVLAGQHAGITKPTPLRDQRGVQPLAAQVRPALTLLAGARVRGQVRQFLRWREPTTSRRPICAWTRTVAHRPIINDGQHRGGKHGSAQRNRS